MDIRKAKRNPSVIHASLVEIGDQLIAKKPVSIILPASFATKGMANISSKVTIIGVYAMFDAEGKNYAVSKATALMEIKPDAIETIKIDDVDYLRFEFEAGGVIVEDLNLMRSKKLTYNVFNHIIDYGNVPWFFNYKDYAELMKNTTYWNDIKLGQSQLVWDILIAHITRSPDNVKQYFRHFITENNQLFDKPLEVPLHDVAATATSNFARLNGPELQRSIKSALLAEPTRIEPLEDLLIR